MVSSPNKNVYPKNLKILLYNNIIFTGKRLFKGKIKAYSRNKSWRTFIKVKKNIYILYFSMTRLWTWYNNHFLQSGQVKGCVIAK